MVEGRAGCAYLGNDSTLDAFDVIIEYERMFAGWMKLLNRVLLWLALMKIK